MQNCNGCLQGVRATHGLFMFSDYPVDHNVRALMFVCGGV